MTAFELRADLHPIASAVLRFFLAPEHGADEDTFLDDMFELVRRLSPEAVLQAGEDLLIVSRFLEAEHRPTAAIKIAKRIDATAKHATQRAGATAILNDAEPAGERFAKFADRPTPADDRPLPSDLRASKKQTATPTLDDKWDGMSDRAKDRLRALVDRFAPPE